MNLRSFLLWHFQDFTGSIIARLLWPRCNAGTVVIREGELLAIDTGDYLMLPTGGMDHGESFEQVAKRETREETGLEVRLEERIREAENSVGGVEVLFTAEVVEGELDGDWEGEPRWIPVEKAKEKRWRYNRDIEELIEKCNT